MQIPVAAGSMLRKEPDMDGFKRWRRIQFEMRHEKQWRPGSARFQSQG